MGQEHIKWHSVTDENVVFSKALLIDLVNQYAIILAFKEWKSVKVFNVLNNYNEDSMMLISPVILVLNLRQTVPANSQRLAAKYNFFDNYYSYNTYIVPYTQLSLD